VTTTPTAIAEIVAKRLVDHFERIGFANMKKLPAAGESALARRFEG
jgi:hypothetical protein